MTAALQRFEELKAFYRAGIPPANNISRKRRREIAWAAAITQVVENTEYEMALGKRHDHAVLDMLRRQVGEHLAAARSETSIEEARRTRRC